MNPPCPEFPTRPHHSPVTASTHRCDRGYICHLSLPLPLPLPPSIFSLLTAKAWDFGPMRSLDAWTGRRWTVLFGTWLSFVCCFGVWCFGGCRVSAQQRRPCLSLNIYKRKIRKRRGRAFPRETVKEGDFVVFYL